MESDTIELCADYQYERDRVGDAAGAGMAFVNLFHASSGEPMKHHGAGDSRAKASAVVSGPEAATGSVTGEVIAPHRPAGNVTEAGRDWECRPRRAWKSAIP
ncbi:hypothetical protein SAMN05444920_105261 [Nonomuraea solani]|uniref:Uncharacterized protein n=1 Tax=Nonomuraea solani TaxID=1144553 RepID=A0A1H6DFF4_9ACTN|nr:hypothetical protein [Nonomuraea solani]SEG83812.1 hypothetical protein SAMN05444920_105261 [Nonomuraea solani]